MDASYKVIFSGRLHPGAQLHPTVEKLVALTGVDPDKATKLLSAGKPAILKKGLPRETAERYVRTLNRLGMQVRLGHPAGAQREAAEPAAAAAPAPLSPSDAAGSDSVAASRTGERDTDGTFRREPARVAAGHGLLWLKRALALFLLEPWKWTGMYVVMFLILAAIGFIPFVGGLVNQIAAFVLAGGLLLGAERLSEGDGLEFSHLFEGLRHHRNQLLLAGVLYLLGSILIVLLAFMPLGAGAFTFFALDGGASGGYAAMEQHWPLLILAVLIGSVLYVPLMMAFFFTPALIAVAGLTSIASIKLSLKATVENWKAFLVYGLALTVLGIVLMVGFTLISGFTSSTAFGGSAVMFILAFFFLLAIIALAIPAMVVFGLSIFTSFRDIFYEQDA